MREFLDKIEIFLGGLDSKDILKAARIMVTLAKIAFRFVPLTAEQKALFNEIVKAATEALDAVK